MKVRLKHDISGTRNGQAWPPAGSEVELSDGEALPLLSSGAAVAVDDKDGDVEKRLTGDPAARGVDPGVAIPPTRERQARVKRAHEPTNLGIADDAQPAEDVNGPRLPEVHAEESARVEAVKPSNAYVGETPAEAEKASAKTVGAKSPKQ